MVHEGRRMEIYMNNAKDSRLYRSALFSMIAFAVGSLVLYFFSDRYGMKGLLFQAAIAIFVGLVCYGLGGSRKSKERNRTTED